VLVDPERPKDNKITGSGPSFRQSSYFKVNEEEDCCVTAVEVEVDATAAEVDAAEVEVEAVEMELDSGVDEDFMTELHSPLANVAASWISSWKTIVPNTASRTSTPRKKEIIFLFVGLQLSQKIMIPLCFDEGPTID
jgi:hypothetical protein